MKGRLDTVTARMQRLLYDLLYHTCPVWSVALALLSVPYVLGHRLAAQLRLDATAGPTQRTEEVAS